jgi:ubiquinone/menaquinone biosynthesis C-methylase UbiE
MNENCYVKAGRPCDSNFKTTITKRLCFIMENLNFEDNHKQSILDIGIGFGIYANELSPHVSRITGIDVEAKNLEKSKNIVSMRKNIDLLLMSAEDLKFPENFFDAAIMIEVLEHVPNDTKALQEIYRVLKPGGKLIVTVPNKLFPFETHGFKIGSHDLAITGLGFPLVTYLPEFLRQYVTYARVYSPIRFRKILTQSHFRIVNTRYFSPNLDQVNTSFPLFRSSVNLFQNKISPRLERSLVRYFLTTIIVCVQKD